MPDPSLRSVGKREAIKDRIRGWIRREGLSPGDRILSQNQLAGRLKASAVTVHKALHELEAEGLLSREKGRGTFVSHAARSTARTRVCLVLPDEGLDRPERNPACWPYVQDLFRVFTEALAGRGTFSVHSLAGSAAPNDLKDLGGYDGVFFLGPDTHRALIRKLIARRTAPVVVLGRSQPDLACLSVDEDRLEGVRTGVRHLTAVGYRRVALLASREWWGDLAVEGYRRGLDEAGLNFERNRVARLGDDFEDARLATRELLRRRVAFDAILADADPCALRALETLREHGIRVPEERGVMGYDGLDLHHAQPPHLTSVRKPLREMLTAALSELARAPGRPTEHKHVGFIGEVLAGRTCRAKTPRN
jgi:DNA-binding LacI/PurR family transcriptional regulator